MSVTGPDSKYFFTIECALQTMHIGELADGIRYHIDYGFQGGVNKVETDAGEFKKQWLPEGVAVDVRKIYLALPTDPKQDKDIRGKFKLNATTVVSDDEDEKEAVKLIKAALEKDALEKDDGGGEFKDVRVVKKVISVVRELKIETRPPGFLDNKTKVKDEAEAAAEAVAKIREAVAGDGDKIKAVDKVIDVISDMKIATRPPVFGDDTRVQWFGLEGCVLSGADLAITRPDGVAVFDARVTFEAKDGFLIHGILSGLVDFGPNSYEEFRKGTGTVDKTYAVALAARFETAMTAPSYAAPRYQQHAIGQWKYSLLTRGEFVALGTVHLAAKRYFPADKIKLDVFQISRPKT
jgi:hypothetical protein